MSQQVTPEELQRALELVRAGVREPVTLTSWRELREALDREVITRDPLGVVVVVILAEVKPSPLEARARLGLPPLPASWWRRLWHTIAPQVGARRTTTSRGSAA